eukprot:XP_024999700.1 vegetative cell wall protein gp1-like [Gallus gallus]
MEARGCSPFPPTRRAPPGPPHTSGPFAAGTHGGPPRRPPDRAEPHCLGAAGPGPLLHGRPFYGAAGTGERRGGGGSRGRTPRLCFPDPLLPRRPRRPALPIADAAPLSRHGERRGRSAAKPDGLRAVRAERGTRPRVGAGIRPVPVRPGGALPIDTRFPRALLALSVPDKTVGGPEGSASLRPRLVWPLIDRTTRPRATGTQRHRGERRLPLPASSGRPRSPAAPQPSAPLCSSPLLSSPLHAAVPQLRAEPFGAVGSGCPHSPFPPPSPSPSPNRARSAAPPRPVPFLPLFGPFIYHSPSRPLWRRAKPPRKAQSRRSERIALRSPRFSFVPISLFPVVPRLGFCLRPSPHSPIADSSSAARPSHGSALQEHKAGGPAALSCVLGVRRALGAEDRGAPPPTPPKMRLSC